MAALASSSRLDLSTAKQHKKSFRSSLSETIRNATSTAAKSKARIAPPDDASRSKGKGRSVDLSPAAVAAALANDDTMKKSTGFLRRLDSKMTFHKRKSADPPPRADIPPPADYGGYVVPSLSRGSMSSPTLHRLANGHADGGNAPSIHALISAPKARRPLIASTRHDPSASTRRRSSSPPTPLAPSPRPSRVRPAIPPSPSTPVLGSYPDPSPRRASAPASRPSVPPLPPPVAFAEPSSPKSGSNSSRRTTRSPTRVSRSPPPPSQSQSQSQFTPSSSPGSGRTLNHARRNSQPVFGTTTIRGSPSPSQSPPSSPSPGPSRFRPARTHSTSPSPHSPHLPSTRPLSGSGFALSPTREAIRSASSFLVKETARAPASMPSDVWLEVEQRMTPLVRMERVWGKSGGAGGEERERRTFCDTLRDGYVLCQLMNKIKPGVIPRVDAREDGFRRCTNVVKFLGAAAALGVPREELFDAEDFGVGVDTGVGAGEAMGRVAETVLAVARLVEEGRAEAAREKEREKEKEKEREKDREGEREREISETGSYVFLEKTVRGAPDVYDKDANVSGNGKQTGGKGVSISISSPSPMGRNPSRRSSGQGHGHGQGQGAPTLIFGQSSVSVSNHPNPPSHSSHGRGRSSSSRPNTAPGQRPPHLLSHSTSNSSANSGVSHGHSRSSEAVVGSVSAGVGGGGGSGGTPHVPTRSPLRLQHSNSQIQIHDPHNNNHFNNSSSSHVNLMNSSTQTNRSDSAPVSPMTTTSEPPLSPSTRPHTGRSTATSYNYYRASLASSRTSVSGLSSGWTDSTAAFSSVGDLGYHHGSGSASASRFGTMRTMDTEATSISIFPGGGAYAESVGSLVGDLGSGGAGAGAGGEKVRESHRESRGESFNNKERPHGQVFPASMSVESLAETEKEVVGRPQPVPVPVPAGVRRDRRSSEAGVDLSRVAEESEDAGCAPVSAVAAPPSSDPNSGDSTSSPNSNPNINTSSTGIISPASPNPNPNPSRSPRTARRPSLGGGGGGKVKVEVRAAEKINLGKGKWPDDYGFFFGSPAMASSPLELELEQEQVEREEVFYEDENENEEEGEGGPGSRSSSRPTPAPVSVPVPTKTVSYQVMAMPPSLAKGMGMAATKRERRRTAELRIPDVVVSPSSPGSALSTSAPGPGSVLAGGGLNLEGRRPRLLKSQSNSSSQVELSSSPSSAAGVPTGGALLMPKRKPRRRESGSQGGDSSSPSSSGRDSSVSPPDTLSQSQSQSQVGASAAPIPRRPPLRRTSGEQYTSKYVPRSPSSGLSMSMSAASASAVSVSTTPAPAPALESAASASVSATESVSPVPFPQTASPPQSAASSPSSSALVAEAAAKAAKAARRSSSRDVGLAARLANLPGSSETLHPHARAGGREGRDGRDSRGGRAGTESKDGESGGEDRFEPMKAIPVRPTSRGGRSMSSPGPIIPIPYSQHQHQVGTPPGSAPLNRRLSIDDDAPRGGGRVRHESTTSSVALMSNNTDINLPQARAMRRISHSAVRQVLVVRGEGKSAMRFQLGKCIGRGQFGSVYQALNLDTGQTVAVKRIRLEGLPEDEVTQLMGEVDLVKSLSHPSIVKYEGMARDSDTLSIVLEFAENGSLGKTLKEYGKLSEELVAGYVIKILEGLNYLHKSEVVHCDLKAANILTTKNGNVKLSDFGVSLNLRAMEQMHDNVAGTPNWMAPEVIQLQGASPASDIWSLGCTIIELFTGRPPYAHLNNGLSVMFRIVEDESPPIPEDCSDELKDFLSQCFEKDPADRPTAELLGEHPWLKQNWGVHKELRPQDSIPFLRRVSADLHSRADITKQFMDSPRFSSSTCDLEPSPPRQHTFVKSSFSQAVECRVCHQSVKRSAVLCQGCNLICHGRCSGSAPACDPWTQLLSMAQSASHSPHTPPQDFYVGSIPAVPSPLSQSVPVTAHDVQASSSAVPSPKLLGGWRKNSTNGSEGVGAQIKQSTLFSRRNNEDRRSRVSDGSSSTTRNSSQRSAFTAGSTSSESRRLAVDTSPTPTPAAAPEPPRSRFLDALPTPTLPQEDPAEPPASTRSKINGRPIHAQAKSSCVVQ